MEIFNTLKLAYALSKKPESIPHITGTCVGPFIIGRCPPGEFKKDWDTDASDIWLKNNWCVMYYEE